MEYPAWTAEQESVMLDLTYEEFIDRFPEHRVRPRSNWKDKRNRLKRREKKRERESPIARFANAIDPDLQPGKTFVELPRRLRETSEWGTPTITGATADVDPDIATNKKVGEFNWREANRYIKGMQDLKHKASWSQDTADIRIDTGDPIFVLALSDTHIGDWATDHSLLESITDEILNTPNLYVLLLGDLAQMAIKLRSVSEVTSNMLPPDLQVAYIDSWLNEIAPRVLAATWDNHAVDREEALTGVSAFARLQNRRFVYHSGIGHPDITVGDETYRFALSHRFLGRSIENPCHAPMRYLRREGHDREVAAMGDFHVPGIIKFTHGATTKVAINTGSFQTHSGYAKRWFSLRTHPVMPGVVLYPDRHEMTPFWSIQEWMSLI